MELIIYIIQLNIYHAVEVKKANIINDISSLIMGNNNTYFIIQF